MGSAICWFVESFGGNAETTLVADDSSRPSLLRACCPGCPSSRARTVTWLFLCGSDVMKTGTSGMQTLRRTSPAPAPRQRCRSIGIGIVQGLAVRFLFPLLLCCLFGFDRSLIAAFGGKLRGWPIAHSVTLSFRRLLVGLAILPVSHKAIKIASRGG